MRSSLTVGLFALTMIASLVPAGQSANAQAAANLFLEARLKRFEDLEDIRQLLADYIRFVDGRDYLHYSQLFVQDGELIFGQNRPKGPEAIRQVMEQGARAAAPDRAAAMARSAHLLTDVNIRVDGNEATATARWTLITRGPDDRPVLSATGHYNDVLVRADGRWKFKRRVVYADVPFQDPFASN